MGRNSKIKTALDDPITIDEVQSCQDAEWIDAIYTEFKDFDVENIELTDEEYKTLTIPQRFIRMLKKYIRKERPIEEEKL